MVRLRAGWVGTAACLALSAQAQTLPGSLPPGPAVAPSPTSRLPAPSLPTAPGEAIGEQLYRPNAVTPAPELGFEWWSPVRRGFIRGEPFFVYPFIGAGVGYDDNVVRASSSEATVGSPFWFVAPRVDAELKRGAHVHGLRYAGRYMRYTNSAADNADDHELVATSVNQFTARADLVAQAYYLLRHDPRGLQRRPILPEPDRWRAAGFSAVVGYGARNAPGRVELEFGATEKEYRNNRSVTAALDASTGNAAARFYYRIAPRTRLLTELRYSSIRYDLAESPFDNYEQRALLGATWDLAAATSGTIKAGYMTKKFNDSALEDYSGANVEAGIRWVPRTYSVVEVLLRRAATDPSDAGASVRAYSVDTVAALTWTHKWRSYFSTRIYAAHSDASYRGSVRDDSMSTLAFAGYFDILTWLRVGLEIAHQRRESTIAALDFSRNSLMLTVGGTL